MLAGKLFDSKSEKIKNFDSESRILCKMSIPSLKRRKYVKENLRIIGCEKSQKNAKFGVLVGGKIQKLTLWKQIFLQNMTLEKNKHFKNRSDAV